MWFEFSGPEQDAHANPAWDERRLDGCAGWGERATLMGFTDPRELVWGSTRRRRMVLKGTGRCLMRLISRSCWQSPRGEPGMSVLEIGTDTGWNAALLAHQLGGANLTSVEIDPGIAAQARTALADAGYGAVTGDGTLGHLSRAPYDRVISTACVYRVPYPWIAQTRPGGLIVTPWARSTTTVTCSR